MASKRRLRRNACDGKTRYAEQQAAHVAAGRASERAGAWISSYKCPFCGAWHIGHVPAQVRRARRLRGKPRRLHKRRRH